MKQFVFILILFCQIFAAPDKNIRFTSVPELELRAINGNYYKGIFLNDTQSSYIFDFDAVDDSLGQQLAFAVTPLYFGVTVDSNTGVFKLDSTYKEWMLEAKEFYLLSIVAYVPRNGQGWFNCRYYSFNFKIYFIHLNKPPVILNPDSIISVKVGDSANYILRFEDENDTNNFQKVSKLPLWNTSFQKTSVFSEFKIKPTIIDTGFDTVTIILKDSTKYTLDIHYSDSVKLIIHSYLMKPVITDHDTTILMRPKTFAEFNISVEDDCPRLTYKNTQTKYCSITNDNSNFSIYSDSIGIDTVYLIVSDEFNSDSLRLIVIIDESVSIKERLKNNNFVKEVKGTIQYSVNKESQVHFEVYNSIGRLIYSFNKIQKSGVYNFNLNFSNGIYFYKIKISNFVKIDKINLVK